MAKLYVCDYCEIRLGELACSNSKGGAYCSPQCANADDEPTTVDATQTSPAVLDMLANLAQRIVALEKANEPVEYAEDDCEDSTQVFPEIPTFKISDLHGKTLRIYSAQDVDGNVIATTTIGVDEATGQAYLIANETEVIE